jgi:hypothetical protein
MTGQTIRPETLARELEAERDCWRWRAIQLSDAGTVLAERLAGLKRPRPAGVKGATDEAG